MHYVNHNIKFFREYKRYTQQDLADMLNTTLGRIKTYETEKAVPSIDMLIQVADLMNISLDTLIKVRLDARNYGKEEARIDSIEKRLRVIEKQRIK